MQESHPHARIAVPNPFAAHEMTNHSRESSPAPQEPCDLADCARKGLAQLRPGHRNESTKRFVFMSFACKNGWCCRFFNEDRTIVLRQIVFRCADKIIETARRGNALANEIDRLCLEQEIATGRGGVWLKLTEKQYQSLCRR